MSRNVHVDGGLKERGKNCSREYMKAQDPLTRPCRRSRANLRILLVYVFCEVLIDKPPYPLNSSNKLAVTYDAQTANTQF